MKLLIQPNKSWYKQERSLPVEGGKIEKKSFDAVEEASCKASYDKVAKLYEEQVQKYRKEREMSPADRQWLETVLKEGTLGDKVSAMLLQIQESPFYSLEYITSLLEMASSHNRTESFGAMEALRDSFIKCIPEGLFGMDEVASSSDLSKTADSSSAISKYLPLLTWRERWLRGMISGHREHCSMSQLLVCYYEDVLLRNFNTFIRLLDISMGDQVQVGRERAMRLMNDLLLEGRSSGLKQTISMLTSLINKMGDPKRKVSSRVHYYLQGIIEKHESLILPAVRAVQNSCLLTSNKATMRTKAAAAEALKKGGKSKKTKAAAAAPVSDKSAFYGLTFFSQIKLNGDSPEVTGILLQTYQHFLEGFIVSLGKAKKLSSKGRGRKEPSSAAALAAATAAIDSIGKDGERGNDNDDNDINGDDDNNNSSSNTKDGASEDGVSRLVKVVLLGLTRALPFANSKGMNDYATKLLSISSKIESYSTLLQASTLILRIFSQASMNGKKKNSNYNTSSYQVISNDNADGDGGGDTRFDGKSIKLFSNLVLTMLLDERKVILASSSHASLFKFLETLLNYLVSNSGGSDAVDEKESLTLIRKVIKKTLSISSIIGNSAFAASALLLASEALLQKPSLRLNITFPEEEAERIEDCAFWELVILARHPNSTVAKYAKILLQHSSKATNGNMTGLIDLREVPSDIFASLSPNTLLENFIKQEQQHGANANANANGQPSFKKLKKISAA